MIIALKLLGILAIYWAAFDIVQIVVAATFVFHGAPHVDTWAALAAWLVTCGISVAFAVILLSRTDWIIARLNLPTEAAPVAFMEPSQLLRVGLVAIGVFTVIQALPEIGRSIYLLGVNASSRNVAIQLQHWKLYFRGSQVPFWMYRDRKIGAVCPRNISTLPGRGKLNHG